jgi:hypothetical protein
MTIYSVAASGTVKGTNYILQQDLHSTIRNQKHLIFSKFNFNTKHTYVIQCKYIFKYSSLKMQVYDSFINALIFLKEVRICVFFCDPLIFLCYQVTQTKAAIGEREGKIDNKTKIEIIKEEVRKIREEHQEQKEEEKKEIERVSNVLSELHPVEMSVK